MKFDMHVKNIRNMKFNGKIFKIHTKKEIYDKFEEFLSKLLQTTLESNFVQIVASARHCWSLSIYFLGYYCIILDYAPSL